MIRMNVDITYPINRIIISDSNINPSTYYGGTWIKLGNFIPRATSGSPGSFGGEDSNTLSISNLPPHDHLTNEALIYTVIPHGTYYGGAWVGGKKETTTGKTGNGQAHNNMPYYRNLCFWKRTA